MDEPEVVYGACLHGRPLNVLGTGVYFAEVCGECEAVLRSEGFCIHNHPALLDVAV